MHWARRRAVPPRILAMLVILGLTAGACANTGATSNSGTKEVGVFATIYPLYYFAARIGGDLVLVRQLVPTGAQPHDWEPSAREMQAVFDADLIVYNGAGFEPWLNQMMTTLPSSGPQILEATRSMDTTGFDGEPGEGNRGQDGPLKDPHVWLDPVRAMGLVESILGGLVGIDPEGETTYRERAGVLMKELQGLHRQFTAGISACRLDTFVVNHTAFSYLAARYRLNQIGIAGLSPDVEPSPARMAQIIKEVQSAGIRYILFETLVNPRVAETIAREVGAKTMVLNPLEGLTRDEKEKGEDYLSIMRQNLETLREALECN